MTDGMNKMLSSLKDKDKNLYQRVTYFISRAKSKEEKKNFVAQVNEFLDGLSNISREITDINERDWLKDAKIRWQSALSALNEPRSIKIFDPRKPLEPPPSPKNYCTKEEIEQSIRQRARQLSKDRLNYQAEALIACIKNVDDITRLPENPEFTKIIHGFIDTKNDQNNDWYAACTDFAISVFTGEIDLVRKISPAFYPRLEEEWLEEAKRLEAYRAWLNRGRGWRQDLKDADFYGACSNVANVLVDAKRKASVVDFTEINQYIRNQYYDDGLLNLKKKETEDLIRRKAQRLHDIGSTYSKDSDWQHAESYVNAYYGNIIEAVENPNDESSEKLYHILTGKEGRRINSSMVNMFEVIVFKYFIRYDRNSKPRT